MIYRISSSLSDSKSEGSKTQLTMMTDVKLGSTSWIWVLETRSPKVLSLLLFCLIITTRVSFVSLHEPGCTKPLGLMTGLVEDWQLAASSVRADEPNCQVKYARLHQPGVQAWCANTEQREDTHHWLLVDLGVMTDVSGLIVQGRGDEPEWVTLFTVAFSQDAYKWDFVLDLYGEKMMFRGNRDSHHIHTVWLDSVVTARFVRIHILEWERHPSLRLEVLGCQDCSSVISGPGIGYGLTASTFGNWAKKNSCQPEDAHIDTHRGWCSRSNNVHQWLQLEIGPPTTVTGILTRGREDTGRRQWVTSYTVSYSNDSSLWYFYKETNHLSPKIFGGNMDKLTERRHYFNSPFVARFVRIHPTSWHNQISMRAALLGCPTKQCPPNYFRLNPLSPCVENLAWQKEVWSNDKKHFFKDWKYGHASLAVDGLDSTLLSECAVMDNYYAETPIWMVDLGRKSEFTGVIVTTWQGDGQDRVTGYRDYVLNLERLVVYVSNKARLDASDLAGEVKCGAVTRGNNALFHPRLRFECGGNSAKGRYVYIQATPVSNRWNQIFNFVLCEVVVYKL